MIVTTDWLIKRFRPREGWGPLLLVLITLLCTPAALYSSRDTATGTGLVLLTLLAAFAGLGLARLRLPAWAAALVGGLLGAVLALVVVGRLLPPFDLLWQEAAYAVEWYEGWRQGVPGWPLPFDSAAGYLWQQASGLAFRIWWWAQTVAGGGQSQDRVVILLLAAFLAWVVALYATWQIYRRRRVLPGLAPTALALTLIAFFRGGTSTFYLAVLLFCTLWLLAVWHLWTQRERWEQAGVDYPGNLRQELIMTLGPWLAILLALTTIFPVLYPNPLRAAFWRMMDAPWTRFEQAVERVVGPLPGADSIGSGAGGGSGGELPRAHLLGGSPDLGEIVVLLIGTSDPPPPPPEAEAFDPPTAPRRYWRSETYDTYTGAGWTNSPLEPRDLPANQFLTPISGSGPDLLQQVRRTRPGDRRMYAANAPYRLDSPVRAWWRAPGDLAQLTGTADAYTVLSRPAEPTIAELRASSPLTVPLPAEIAERYLALPDTVPRRVLDLAAEVVNAPASDGAPTRYDRARAIEAFLRTYPYTLDLPEPPDDRDLVDHFLFELQEGYCDYYASSMVVMARAVGVPARLAIGYAQGTFDYGQQRWVVTEQNGHSWVEVYFDGIGWVEFEPTAGLPALARPDGRAGEETAPPPRPLPPARWWQRVPWALIGLGLAVLLLAGLILWLWRPRRTPDATSLVRDRQARLLRWGARLGAPFRDGQTAGEYGRALGQTLRARGVGARWSRTRRAAEEAPEAVEHLAGAYVRARYSPAPVEAREGWRVRDLWVRLRRQLWWLWLGARRPDDQ